MLLAEDFRAMARDALRGRWPGAAGVALLAAFLGATMVDGASFNFNVGQKDVELFRRIYEGGAWHAYMGFIIGAAIILIVYWLVRLVIGGAVTLGYAQYNLNLMDRKEAQVTDLFCHFNRLGTAFCMQFLRGLYIFLWSLLFVIPGIIASYRYAMAPFILAEHPEMGAGEAITTSKEMMQGNKFRLFCLELSFIGWSLLCAVPAILLMSIAGVYSYRLGALITVPMFALSAVITWGGSCFLSAYISAAAASFYRDISRGPEAAAPEDSPWDSAY